LIRQQPTTLGELDGRSSVRVRGIARELRRCGFATAISRHMDAWLKVHAFFVTAISGAICLTDGDCRRLAGESATIGLMTDGVREGFAAVRALGLPVSPFQLKVLFTWLPRRFAVNYWRRFFATDMADYVFGRHVRAAAREMSAMAADCRAMTMQAGVRTPALARLHAAIDAYARR